MVELGFGIEQNYAEALEMYKSHNVDLVRLEYDTYEVRHEYIGEYISLPVGGTFHVVFDTSQPPFDDIRVRKAFIMAVDRMRLIEEVLGGYSDPATGGLVPPGIPGHSKDIALPYDPNRALQLLMQAGYSQEKSFPVLEIIVWPRRKYIVEYLKDQWMQNLKLEVDIKITDWNKFDGKRKSNYLSFWGWSADYLDPDDYLRMCVRSQAPHWRNENYDHILEQAHQSLDQEERIRLYKMADKIIIDEAVIMPIAYDREHYLVKPWLLIPGNNFSRLKDFVLKPH